jgi:hypothetical protein
MTGCAVKTTIEQGLEENNAIPESLPEIKGPHRSIFRFDMDDAGDKARKYNSASVSEADFSEFSDFEQRLRQAYENAVEFLGQDSGLEHGTNHANAIIEFAQLWQETMPGIYENTRNAFRKVSAQIGKNSKSRQKLMQLRKRQENLAKIYEFILSGYDEESRAKLRDRTIEHYIQKSNGFSELRKQLDSLWEAYFAANEDQTQKIAQELCNSGFAKKCAKAGYYEGGLESDELAGEIEYFTRTRSHKVELKIENRKKELCQQIDALQKMSSLDEFAQISYEKIAEKSSMRRLARRYEEYNSLVTALKEELDSKISRILRQEKDRLGQEYNDAVAYDDIEELESGISALESIQKSADELGFKLSKIQDVKEMPSYHVNYNLGIRKLAKDIAGKKPELEAELQQARKDLETVTVESEKISECIARIDLLERQYSKNQISLLKFIDSVLDLALPDRSLMQNRLIEDEVEDRNHNYDVFESRKEKVHEKIEAELKTQCTKLSDNIIETGIDFDQDNSMLETNKLKLEELKSCYKRFSVSKAPDYSALQAVEEKINKMSQQYSVVSANISQIKKETEKISRLVETESVGELRKLQLDENRFSFTGSYYEIFLHHYQETVSSAKQLISNGSQNNGIFHFEKHMQKFRPVNKDYLMFPKIVLGTYKNMPLTKRPELFEEKIRALPLAECERDFAYMEGLKNALEAWKERGPLSSMLMASGSSKYAVDKMVACVENYIQKSRENLIN